MKNCGIVMIWLGMSVRSERSEDGRRGLKGGQFGVGGVVGVLLLEEGTAFLDLGGMIEET